MQQMDLNMIIYYVVLGGTFLLGGGLFIKWLAETEFGIKSLDSAPSRPNTMPYYFPFAVLFGWLVLSSLGSTVIESVTSEEIDWQQKFATFGFYFFVEVIAVIFILFAVNRFFVNGLSGFGLRIKGIFRDICHSTLMFIGTWPFVAFAIFLVAFFGQLIMGSDFEMQKNEGLEVLLGYKQLSLRILMIVFAALLTPIFEELVFRGLLQTYLRETLGYKPWTSIFVVAGIFAVLHPLMHFPGIFILAVVMGYAYEKSGSLLRPMLIHCFFNSWQIALALFFQS
jgi:membrane protease YdiL (CAAX protease family)